MRDFKKLQIWEKSHALTLRIYELTSQFPRDEIYGLKSQIRRSSASIPTNIAEGSGRESAAEFKRFLHIAMGSASETEYLILLAHDLKYINRTQYTELSNTTIMVKKMITSLIKKVKTDS